MDEETTPIVIDTPKEENVPTLENQEQNMDESNKVTVFDDNVSIHAKVADVQGQVIDLNGRVQTITDQVEDLKNPETISIPVPQIQLNKETIDLTSFM